VNSTINTQIDLKSNKKYFKNSKVVLENNKILKESFVPTIYNVEHKIIQNNKILNN